MKQYYPYDALFYVTSALISYSDEINRQKLMFASELLYNFITKHISSKIKYNSKDHYKILKKFYLILDNSSLDLFWYKYDHQFEHRDKNFGDIKGNTDIHLSFFKWLNLK